MPKLIALGTLSALFFSSTFILNRAMSLEGGHWVWSAALRYAFIILFIHIYLWLTAGRRALVEVYRLLFKYWRFWLLTGTVGVGVFYSFISFSASYAAAWIVATTWQTTILATPVVLSFFDRKVPRRGVLLIGVIFTGIVLVNIEHAALTSWQSVLLSALPILVSAFTYPAGNQMVWEAQQGESKWVPSIQHPLLKNSFVRVLLLSLGSVPYWLLLAAVTAPPPPSTGQLINTALVALSSGFIATTLFFYARQRCQFAYEIAAVDATQAMEVIFSLIGEILFLHGALPGALGMAGVIITLAGLAAYMLLQNTAPQAPS